MSAVSSVLIFISVLLIVLSSKRSTGASYCELFYERGSRLPSLFTKRATEENYCEGKGFPDYGIIDFRIPRP